MSNIKIGGNMFKDKIKQMGKHEENNKKKIENLVVLVVILIITIIIINFILKGGSSETKEQNQNDPYKTLANMNSNSTGNEIDNTNLKYNLEQILTTIKGVGKVNVFINYSESSKVVAMYDEKTTTSATEETDSAGGLRNTTSTETQKDVIFSEEDGNQVPMTEKIIMPTIEGAIITAQGAKNVTVKTNIISAVEAATGLSKDKIQVFEMEG